MALLRPKVIFPEELCPFKGHSSMYNVNEEVVRVLEFLSLTLFEYHCSSTWFFKYQCSNSVFSMSQCIILLFFLVEWQLCSLSEARRQL